ncbi:response regulator [bacterium]|nr:response regulator [bacterium]
MSKSATQKERESLKTREQKYSVLFESSQDAIIVLEPPKWYFTDWNRTFLKMFHISEALEAGEYSPVSLSPEYQPDGTLSATKAQQMIASAMEKDKNFFEWEHQTIDGTPFPATVLLSKIIIDGKEFLQATIRDVSERKKAELELQESERKYRSIIENMVDGYYRTDLAGKMILASPSAAEMFGATSVDEVIGLDVAEKFYADPTKRADFLKALKENGGRIRNYEMDLKNRKGDIIPALTNSNFYFDSHGNIAGIEGIFSDITERKQMEKRLVIEKEKALAASKAKSEFLANMSHEIRTPLNGIIGFTDLLKNTPLSELQKQYLENTNSSAHTLLGIINDILDFSKIEANRLDLEIIKVDIIDLLEESMDIIKFQAAKKNLELLLNVDSSVPRFVSLDPLRLKQVLANLLGNAIKFTPKGEVELQVSFSQINATEGKFLFAICDTGIGISAQQQKKLFNAFSQADSSTTRKYGGSGLGLVISELIVKKMGGAITVKSQENSGSTFSFEIKTTYEHGDALDTTTLAHIKRVLVIDDNANNRMILEHMLIQWGVEYTGCESGQSALETIKTANPFDVIIVDFHMPEMDGLETIKQLRKAMNIPLEEQPIILLHSSSETPGLHHDCKQLGIRFKLVKPVKSRELFEYLSNIHSDTFISTIDDEDDSSLKAEVYEESPIYAHDATILVAEDNELNMMLIKILLKQLLPNVTIIEAFDGADTLAKIKMVIPDMILMDIQMPIMDGIVATTHIREFEKSLPIIAVTAGVLDDKKQQCFDAGMNGFLQKPIAKNELTEILNTFLLSRIEETKEEEIDDAAHFNKKSFLEKINYDEQFFNEIIELVKSTVPDMLSLLKKAVTEDDRKLISDTAHNIKGSSANIAFNHLAALAKEMEQAAEAGTKKQLQKTLNKIEKEWKILLLLIA